MISNLKKAEEALERGDYIKCLEISEDLAKDHPINSDIGAQIGMIMITAFMGLGKNDIAIEKCKELTKSKNNETRQYAKNLLPILQSPNLAKPKNWSLKIPVLEISSQTEKELCSAKKLNKIDKYNMPPTGPTKELEKGYLSIVFIILIFLIVFLK
tara:strand:- start:542 stop:1009 length:468 start_codon:yes stop_codon:yes gene_type:complete